MLKCHVIAVVPVQQRFSSHGYGNDIGPPASFNQLPQPEGDWSENHNKKQQKYNAVLAAAALFFAATFGFVSGPPIWWSYLDDFSIEITNISIFIS